jgi:hypothetical protein
MGPGPHKSRETDDSVIKIRRNDISSLFEALCNLALPFLCAEIGINYTKEKPSIARSQP